MKMPESYHASNPSLGEGLLDTESQRTLADMARRVSLGQIQGDFATTQSGKHMAAMVRFQERFQPKNYPDELWVSYLGPQASNLAHGEYIRLLGDQLLAFEPQFADTDLSEVQRFMFGFTNLTHDWGESDPDVGDVAFGNHKPNREKERATRSALARETLYRACTTAGISAETYPNLDNVINKLVNWSDFTSFTKPDFSELAQGGSINPAEYYQHLYRATKYLGHFSTALRAGRLVRDGEHKPVLKAAAMALSIQVTHNALPVLIEYAHVFEGVKVYLNGHCGLIDEIIQDASRMYKSTTTNYNDEYERPLKLCELNARWNMYKDVTNLISASRGR